MWKLAQRKENTSFSFSFVFSTSTSTTATKNINKWHWLDVKESLSKSGPLRFTSENLFPLNFTHEYILIKK